MSFYSKLELKLFIVLISSHDIRRIVKPLCLDRYISPAEIIVHCLADTNGSIFPYTRTIRYWDT